MTRINLQIDDKFAAILQYLQLDYPLLTEPDIIKIAVGNFYQSQKAKENKTQLSKKLQERKAWADSLPTLELTPEQTATLEKNLEESIASGFDGPFTTEEFLKEMAS